MKLHSCPSCDRAGEAIPERCPHYDSADCCDSFADASPSTISWHEEAVWDAMVSRRPALASVR